MLVYVKRKVGKMTLILQALKGGADISVYFECLRVSLRENIAGLAFALTRQVIARVYGV